MPPGRGYSAAIKQEVVQLIESGLSMSDAAERANISPSTARRWWKMYEAGGPEALGIEVVATENDPTLLESADPQILGTSHNAEYAEDEVDDGEEGGAEFDVTSGDATETLESAEEPTNLATSLAGQAPVDLEQAPCPLGQDEGTPAERAGSESGRQQAWRNLKTNLNVSLDDNEWGIVAFIGIALAVASIIWIVDLATDASTRECRIGVIQAEIVQAAIADRAILWDPYWTERFASERSAIDWIADKRDWFFSECRPYLEEESRPDQIQRIWFVFGLNP